jgi:hypothetical protein
MRFVKSSSISGRFHFSQDRLAQSDRITLTASSVFYDLPGDKRGARVIAVKVQSCARIVKRCDQGLHGFRIEYAVLENVDRHRRLPPFRREHKQLTHTSTGAHGCCWGCTYLRVSA